jgi:hypothetical protein
VDYEKNILLVVTNVTRKRNLKNKKDLVTYPSIGNFMEIIKKYTWRDLKWDWWPAKLENGIRRVHI